MSEDNPSTSPFVKEVRGNQCTDDNITVDIIAVSAVAADPIKTWRTGSSRTTWLDNDLLQQLPLARVLYYDHVVTPNADLASLALRLQRTLDERYFSEIITFGQTGKRALIFLCHSTGGLVVKQALANIWASNANYSFYRRSIIGVAFFAVPHWGSQTLSNPEFVRTARKRIDDTWEYDAPRKSKSWKNKLIYKEPLPPKFARTVASDGEGLFLKRLGGLFKTIVSDSNTDGNHVSVWAIHETIPTVFEPPWYEKDPDQRDLLVPQLQIRSVEQVTIGTNISVPCDHYGTASFDTMHAIEERCHGALGHDSLPSFQSNFILQLQARVSEHFWSSEDVTMSLRVENFHFYKDGDDMLYTVKSLPLVELVEDEDESKFAELLHVEIPYNVQPAARKYSPIPTRTAKMPVSVLKPPRTSIKKIRTSQPGTPSASFDDGRGAASSSKSVRILAGSMIVSLPDDAYESARTSRDESEGDKSSRRSSIQVQSGTLKEGTSDVSTAQIPKSSGINRTTFQDEDHASLSGSLQSVTSHCRWVHVPCNHILWTEKVVSGIGAATDNEDHCEQMLEEKHWEKKINYATHDFPHARYIHSGCEFLGLPASEPKISSQLLELLGAEGVSISEKLMRHMTDNKSTGKGHSESLRDASSSARQMLFMPYLHWESFQQFKHREAMIHNRMRLELRGKEGEEPNQVESQTFGREIMASHARLEGQLLLDVPLFTRLKGYFDNSPELKLIWQYLGTDTLLHCRRTLDQFMYSTLPDTSARDRDQILYKCDQFDAGHMAADGEDVEAAQDESKENENDKRRKILVVEQLWMFVLDNDTLITFFPPKEVQDESSDLMISSATELDIPSYLSGILRTHGDLRACIVEDLEEEAEFIDSQWDLAALVVKHVITVFCSDTGPRIFSNFGKYVERLTEKQAQSWSKLHLRSGKTLGGSSKEIQQIFQDLRDLRELRDVEDELRIIKKVLDKQKTHIETMKRIYSESLGRVETRGFKYLEEGLSVLDRNLDRLWRMLNNVELTSKGYEELLSLQQNQISINEAVAAGEQSRAVTIFTVFTVLFLPLSFFTSVFGMNVQEWSGTSTNVSLKLVLAWMIPVSCIVIALTFLFAMNSNFRDMFVTALELLGEFLSLVIEIPMRVPGVSSGVKWVITMTVVPLGRSLNARKRRRMDMKPSRSPTSNIVTETVTDGKRIRVRGEIEKGKDGSAVSEAVPGGQGKRVRWRTLFRRRHQNDGPARNIVSGVDV